MKQYLFFCCLPVFFLAACNTKPSIPSEEYELARTGLPKNKPDLSLMGKVKFVSTTEYEARIMFGEITPTKELKYDSIVYDEFGYSQFNYNVEYKKNEASTTSIEYNLNHDIVKRTMIYSWNGQTKTLVETMKYDEYNNIIEHILPIEYLDIIDTTYYAYDYDQYGRVLTSSSSDNERTTYQYNSLGFVTESAEYKNDSITREITTTYFRDSLLLSQIDDQIDRTFTIDIQYDSLGNKLVEKKTGGLTTGTTTYSPDGSSIWITAEGDVYESKNGRLVKIRRVKKSENWPYEESFDYDQWGNKLTDESLWWYNDNLFGGYVSDVIISYEYQYDKHHNWIKKAQYSQLRGKEKNLRSLYVRNIEYYE